jgi:hypothetical protein
MLAALRVLHVDTSHTPANDAVIEERPQLETYQRSERVTVVDESMMSGRVAIEAGRRIR